MSTGRVASVSTGVVAAVTAGVCLLSLVVLSDLDGLLDMVEFNANDSLLRYAVHGGRGAIVRRNVSMSVSVAEAGARLLLVLDLLGQEDFLDFVEELRVYEVSLAFGMADGHGRVVSAAAEASQGDGG